MKKKLSIIVLTIMLVFIISVVSFAARVISLGHTVATDSAYHQGALRFKELVEEHSNGELKIQIYPQSQLGWERDMLEGMQLGTVDMCISATGPFAVFVPEFVMMDFPFLFKNVDHLKWFMYESEAAQKLKTAALDKGFKVLAIGGPSFRIPFADRFIEKPADLQGMKMRLMGVPIHRDSYKAMGASVTSTDFAELYSALQMGVVDGAENTYNAIYAMKFYEVTDHITELPVFTGADVLLMSELTYNSLSAEEKDIVEKAAVEAWKYHDRQYEELDAKDKQKMLDLGTRIKEDVDLAPFITKVKPVYEKYLADQPDWVRGAVKEIQEAADRF